MDITSDFGSDVPGSNPGEGTGNKNEEHGIIPLGSGYGSMVEHLVANQMMGVRFSLPAPGLVGIVRNDIGAGKSRMRACESFISEIIEICGPQHEKMAEMSHFACLFIPCLKSG